MRSRSTASLPTETDTPCTNVMDLTNNMLAEGKRLLINAALKLTEDTRNLNALSLRELAREAGLNPNTFYRHFRNLDELGLVLIDEISNHIRQPLRDLRRQASEAVEAEHGRRIANWETDPELSLVKSVEVTRKTVRLFLEYAATNSAAITIGVRELHGASPRLREALRRMMGHFAADMAEDIRHYELMPPVPTAVLATVADSITREMFSLAMDYTEQADRREEIACQAEEFVIALFTGFAMLQGNGVLLAQAMQPALLQELGLRKSGPDKAAVE